MLRQLSRSHKLRVATAAAASTQRRWATSAAFVATVERLNAEYKASRSPQILTNLRAFYDSEPIVDAPKSMTAELAVAICNTAVTHRINPTNCSALAAVCEWVLQPDVAAVLDAATISRICNCCVALHAPLTFEVLFTLLWRVVELAPIMDATVVSVTINAYGRGGVFHKALFDALVHRAKKVLVRTNTDVTIANVANVAHALSRVDAYDEDLFKDLAEHALRLQAKAVPLVIATILDAFAKCGAVEPVLFETYEGLAAAQIEQFAPPLLASMFHSLSLAGRTESKLFATFAARAVRVGAQFDAASIARTLDAFRTSGKASEELFGVLAERACAIPQEFRLKEARQTLQALAQFDLYDAELFPLLSARAVSLLRQKGGSAGSGVADVDDVVGILASFAAVGERREDLVSYSLPLLSSHATAMAPATIIDALWALDALNVRGETTKQLADAARSKYAVVAAFVATEAKEKSTAQRWKSVVRAFKLDK